MDCDRLFWAKFIIVAGVSWALLSTERLWKSSRHCPKTPIWSRLPQLPYEEAIYPALFLLLALIAVLKTPVLPILAFVILIGSLCAVDWTRFRPWVYQNSFLLLALAVCNGGGASPAHQQEALNIGRLITVSIYFWAGVLKFNWLFFNLSFPWMVGPLLTRLPRKAQGPLRKLGYAVPLLEAGFALGLLLPSFRMTALGLVVAMHGLILFCFSPLGHKVFRSIWPWNVSMMLTTVALFWGTDNVGPGDIMLGDCSCFHLGVLLLFAVLPVLGLFNLLDPVFTHGHMSGRHISGCIALSTRLYGRLPGPVQAHCVACGVGLGKFYSLDLAQWYLGELGVPQPQQERLIKHIARDFGRYGATRADLNLTLIQMPGFSSQAYPQKVYSWSELLCEPSLSTGVPL